MPYPETFDQISLKTIVFLTCDATRTWGSAILRAQQMAALSLDLFSVKGFNIVYTTDDKEIRDSLVIVNKGYLEFGHVRQLKRLRRRRNILVADYVDFKIPTDHLEFFHAFLASSHAQAAWLRAHVPHKPVFHVTHIVDTRLPDLSVSSDRLRIGYFGILINACYVDELGDRIDFFETIGENPSWMRHLETHNCHYALRRRLPWNGFKPFIKGFVAAKYGCPIIIAADDGDALAYLGEDYPYFVSDTSLEAVNDLLAEMKQDFGGPRWRSAVEIMAKVRAKSTLAVVRAEWKTAVDSLIGGQSSAPRRRLFGP